MNSRGCATVHCGSSGAAYRHGVGKVVLQVLDGALRHKKTYFS